MTTADHLSAKTRRRLSRSPYAPIPAAGDDDVALLRTDVLARLLLERLASCGPMLESDAIDSLDNRAGVVGRGAEIVTYAAQRGLIRRVHNGDDESPTLEALGAPRTLAA